MIIFLYRTYLVDKMSVIYPCPICQVDMIELKYRSYISGTTYIYSHPDCGVYLVII